MLIMMAIVLFTIFSIAKFGYELKLYAMSGVDPRHRLINSGDKYFLQLQKHCRKSSASIEQLVE